MCTASSYSQAHPYRELLLLLLLLLLCAGVLMLLLRLFRHPCGAVSTHTRWRTTSCGCDCRQLLG